MTESIPRGEPAGRGNALQHGDREVQPDPAETSGRAHSHSQRHAATEPGVRDAAQHQDQAGGRDRRVPETSGRRAGPHQVSARSREDETLQIQARIGRSRVFDVHLTSM